MQKLNLAIIRAGRMGIPHYSIINSHLFRLQMS
jgi:hypothetical protein